MGYYINPPGDMTKEDWLAENAIRIPEIDAQKHNFDSNTLPICLVSNREGFTAAGIAYDQHELLSWFIPDGRTKKWYLALKSDLLPYYNPPKKRKEGFMPMHDVLSQLLRK